MTEQSTVGVVVIGAGNIGRQHAAIWRGLDSSHLASVVDVHLDRAREVADRYDVAAYVDAGEAMAQPDVAAVSIASPDHLHFDLVMAAIHAGKHVFVEKPLTTDVEQAGRIAAAAEHAGVIVHVNFSQRWLQEYVEIKRVIDSGEIGAPQFAVSVKRDTVHVPTRMLPWAAASSPVYFMTSHDLDLLRWYFAADIERVSAVETRGAIERLGVPAHDAVNALAIFRGGGTVTFSTSWSHPATYPVIAEDRLEIVGTHGVIEYRGRTRELDVRSERGGRTTVFGEPYYTSEIEGTFVGAVPGSCAAFVDELLGKADAMTSAASNVNAVATQWAMLRSVEEDGAWMRVE